jgi:magnesium-dependent phosphatase 1
MPFDLKERSNEMLLPTQVQRSLFYFTEISDAEAEQAPIRFHSQLQTRAWNNSMPEETKQDFLKLGETIIYDSIAME